MNRDRVVVKMERQGDVERKAAAYDSLSIAVRDYLSKMAVEQRILDFRLRQIEEKL